MRKNNFERGFKMKIEIKESIEEYVLREVEDLNTLDKNTDGYDDIVNSSIKNVIALTELLQKEDVNISNEHLENRKIDISEIKNNNDYEIKKDEIKVNTKKDIELRNDRLVKVVTDGATILIPIIFYNVWMKKGFKFEETGTYCSNTFKNLFNKFKPTK